MTPEKFHDALTLLSPDLIAEADEMRRGKPKILPLRRYAALAASLALVLFCGGLLTGRLLPRMGSMKTEQAACDLAPAEAAPKLDAADTAENQSCGTVSGNGTVNRAESTAEEPAATEQALCSLPTAPAAAEEGLPEFGWDTENDPGDIPQPIVSDQYSTPFNPDCSVNMYSVPDALLLTCRAELEQYIQEYGAVYDFTRLEKELYRYGEDWFEEQDLLLTVIHSASTGTPYNVSSVKDARGLNDKGWEWYVLIYCGDYYPNHPETNFHLLTPLPKGLIAPEDSILTIMDGSEETVK